MSSTPIDSGIHALGPIGRPVVRETTHWPINAPEDLVLLQMLRSDGDVAQPGRPTDATMRRGRISVVQ
jgi:hypothetical protein